MTFCPTVKATFAAMAALSMLALHASAATPSKKPAIAASNTKKVAPRTPKRRSPRRRSPARRFRCRAAGRLRLPAAPMSRRPRSHQPHRSSPRRLPRCRSFRPRTFQAPQCPAPSSPRHRSRPRCPPASPRNPVALAAAPVAAASGEDIAAVKKAVDFLRAGKATAATETEKSISNPVARKLIEWLVLRADNGDAGFGRYAAFIAANPSWPSINLLRKRAEGALWEERRAPATVLSFFDATRPTSAKGRLALARALLTTGERGEAEASCARRGARMPCRTTSSPR